MSTAAIAKFVANLAYADIPQAAVAVAKNCIIDGLGISLAGSKSHPGEIIISHVREAGGRPEAGVAGARLRVPAAQAALANGVLAHALNYDDGISAWGGHLTSAVLPAVLAICERDRKSGAETIAAFVAGWEVGEKIGAVIGAEINEIGWHSHSVVGPLAAAAASAKALKLDQRGIKMALGIASSGAGGLRLNLGTDTNPFHAGRSAWNGLVAALLAQKGFTASEDFLDMDLGLPKVLTQKQWDPARFARTLGSPYGLISPGPAQKLYPSCFRTQRSIDAVLYLRAGYHFRPEEVAEIECRTSRWAQKILSYSRPETVEQAKYSMEYCLAAAVLDGEVTLRQFTDARVASADVRSFMPKVKYASLGEGEDVSEDTVTVKLLGGRQYSHTVAHARGEPENPMDREDLVLKFGACAESVLPQRDIDQIVEWVLNLEYLEDITPLMRAVTGE
ncbi:MAG: MmgE/PrpD family protein [Chloroflexi bacterium]|nr:MmgE/PrpD family protein [Chloroflexota bacterium]